MLLRRTLILIYIAALTATMTGCLETSKLSMSGILNRAGGAQPVADSLEKMPPEAAQMTGCIIDSLSGKKCKRTANIDAALKQKLHQANLVDTGFVFHSANLLTIKQDSKNLDLHTAQGQIVFEDTLQRRISINYESEYIVDGESLKILAATVRLAKVQPKSVCFIVKSGDLNLNLDKVPSFKDLYQRARKLAIDPTVAQKSPEQDYTLLVFFMDKTTPEAKMHLRLSDTAVGPDGYESSSRYLNYNNGWRVGFVRGKINLMNTASDYNLYLKAVHTPGKEAGFFKTPRLVGLYSLIEKAAK